MKKVALKAMVVLAIVIALCMFFSGTVRTITTPRVRFLSAKQGKFESRTELTGTVVFTQTEEFRLDLPEDISVSFTGIYVKPGQKVKAGDRLFTARVVDFDKTAASIRADYAAAEASLRELNRKHGSVRLTRNEQAWADAYYALEAASDARRERRVELMTIMTMEGLIKRGDPLPDEAPEGASEAVIEAYQALSEAESEYAACEQAFNDLSRYAIEEDTWTYLRQAREYEEKMAGYENQLAELSMNARYAREIVALHDGYVSEVLVEKGGTATGGTVVLKMTPEDGQPVIRIDVTDVTQTVAVGSVVSLPDARYGKTETTVADIGTDSAGKRYADASITDDVVDALGSVSAMMQGDVKVELVIKSREATCLLAAAAVRGTGEERYIYYAERVSSTFGGTQLIVRKMAITVLNESSTTVSIEEDLSHYQIIYMEDRTLSEGDAVMAYDA